MDGGLERGGRRRELGASVNGYVYGIRARARACLCM